MKMNIQDEMLGTGRLMSRIKLSYDFSEGAVLAYFAKFADVVITSKKLNFFIIKN